MNSVEQQKKHFDSIAEQYFNAYQSRNCLIFKDLLWQYFFQDKQFLQAKVIDVLEPMCGYGEGKKIIEKYLKKRINYYGFDNSPAIIQLAKEKEPDLNIREMNVLDFKEEEKYDLIIVIGGLHHVHKQAKEIIFRFHRALKPGGYFLCYEATSNNFLTNFIREKIYKANPLFDYETERAFALTQLNCYLKQSGFKIIDQIYPGLISYVLYFNPCLLPFFKERASWLVKFFFCLDKLFMGNFIGRKLSFATLTLLKK